MTQHTPHSYIHYMYASYYINSPPAIELATSVQVVVKSTAGSTVPVTCPKPTL